MLSSHATWIPSSPPLDPRYRGVSPTSSEPAVFSSDDPPDAADVSNYESPRYKRKRAGGWWETEPGPSQPVPERKKAKMSRNLDSGVWLQSDGTDSSQEASGDQPPSSDINVPDRSPFAQDTLEGRVVPGTQDISPAEAEMRRILQKNLEFGSTVYELNDLGLNDDELHHIGQLNQVILAPPDPGIDVPAEGQYRPMIPEIFVSLHMNNLSLLTPSLFTLQHLTTLVLRGNHIQELPPQICHLRALRALDLCQNNLRWLPFEILHLFPPQGRLQRLQLVGNPLVEEGTLRSALLGSLTDCLNEISRGERGSFSSQIQQLYNALPRAPNLRTYLCRIRFEETWNSSPMFATTPDHRNVFPMRYGRTPITYYDQAGRILKGSFALKASNTGNSDLIMDTARGSYRVPPTWFEPSRRSGAPSLLKVSIHTALANEEGGIPVIREKLGEDPPLDADVMLSRAADNMASVYRHFRSCHTCGKDYVVAAAEWIEFWSRGFYEVFPIMLRVCSWNCVPDELARRPQELRW